MAVRRSLVAGLGLALLAPLASPGVGSAAPTPDPVVTKAVTWLDSQQQADGSFEVSGFPGFETSDAILALAESGQTENAWDFEDARADVHAVQQNGKNALDAIDDLVDSGDTTTVAAAARGAKVMALVANPLGYSASDFDPSSDSATPVDLVGRIDAFVQPDGSLAFGGQFNGVLYAAIGLAGAGATEPSGILAQIEAAQRSDGSWNYAGTTEATDPAPPDGPIAGDVDTTAVALLALKDLGQDRTDASVANGLKYLAAQQQADGAWQAFGSDDPNSTSSAAVALSALHLDISTGAWHTAVGATNGTTFASPYVYLAGLQAADGHIVSPNDGFGVNTFATTQSVEALARQWFLSSEFTALANHLSAFLGSPAASPTTNAAGLAADTVGPNPSIAAKRLAAATAVVNSQLGREAAASDLFVQGLGRTIDPSGRTYWSKKLLTIKRPQMLSRLTGSSEFFRKNGATSGGFVSAVYLKVLGRAADPSGKAYWVKKIDKGDSVLHVAQSLVASSEYERHEVRDAYVRVLDRQPTPSESTAGIALVAGSRVETLLAQLGGSLELYENVAS